MVRGLITTKKSMTHFENESELEKLSETKLRLKLSQAFNALGVLEKSSREYTQARTSVETLKRALAKRLYDPHL